MSDSVNHPIHYNTHPSGVELPTDRQRLCRFMQDVKSMARPKIESQWAAAKLDEMIEDFLLDILELAHATKP